MPGREGLERHTGDLGRLNIRNVEISAKTILFLSQRANCLSEASFLPFVAVWNRMVLAEKFPVSDIAAPNLLCAIPILPAPAFPRP